MNNKQISKIIRSRRRSVALVITAAGELEVRAPFSVSQHYIEKLVMQKHNWVEKKIAEARQRLTQKVPINFIDGEKILYLGNEYSLKISAARDIILLNNELHFPEKHLPQAKAYLIYWYQKTALDIIGSRVKYFAEREGLSYHSIKITKATRRWGSCSHKAGLCFSWRLIMAPLEVVDSVVVHELAHLLQKNHSKKFWAEVEKIMPNYKEYRLWLRQHGHRLDF
jgi:predicted metal-dependent hydrolase